MSHQSHPVFLSKLTTSAQHSGYYVGRLVGGTLKSRVVYTLPGYSSKS